ncbi:hypothetical protein OTERR_13150 [Oryzomicrobium terrae]|uniref:Large polyvalent protein-associated domain-containing protein n=1 Tax=Oryzomicrobium terrae TaxID=1735038 RepID=A0A5C1E782_9RHOO|nr:PLxRFG domain-containing protein [Oryzomicrobium terrae]QEL64791.1 hypothetical protein OTERR_13150 [Oryzomicrobium terrae]
MTCTYKITGADGKAVTLTGQNAMKAYLAEGGLQELLPGWGGSASEILSDEQVAAQKPAPVMAAKGAITDFGEKIGGARKDKATSGAKRASKPTDERPAWARRFEISQVVSSNRLGEVGRWVIRDTRKTDFLGQAKKMPGDYSTREEAEKALPLLAVAQKHRVVSAGKDGGWEIWRDVTDRKRVKVVEQTFPSRDEALRYMADNAEAIINTSTTFGETDLPRPQSTQREGVERRTGPAKDTDFTDTFGFRGVEFGNWNNQEERQQLLDDAYDGLLDLAEVMGIPPRAMSLNGELALAFGARGHGLSGARAHYEPNKAVINLTKMNGAGSLAHEWFHALDHYFGRQDGKSSTEWVTDKDGTRSLKASNSFENDAASSGFRRTNSGVREEVRGAYQALMKTMTLKAEQYVEDTARADRFVAGARQNVADQLQRMRQDLAEQKDPQYWKRNNKPATAEQLAQFDTVAQQIIEGTALEAELRSSVKEGTRVSSRSIMSGARWTNDALEALSAINKAVRGRSGFTSDQAGILDRLRDSMSTYSARLKMLADAQSGSEKTKQVPTSFAMDAKELDQGRGSDYWTTPHEMAARAFQGYVEDKIAAGGGKSPFLNHAPERAVIETPWGWKRPYPHGAERKAINAAFDKLVATIQVKDGENGNKVLFSFAGRKAQGADLHALNTAQQRLARGEDAEAVRQATGWHRGADGKWRFEISDHQASIAVGGLTAGDVIDLARVVAMADGRNQVAVGDVLAHDRLFAAYPHLADIPVSVMPSGERSTAKLRNRGGKLTLEVKAGVPRAELPSVLMHELQHAIQLKEGFALGGTAKPLAGGAVSALDQAGAITYRRLAGEVEARNTQARMNMSPRARMDIAPEESADIPASQVLVTFNGRDLADLPGPRNASGAPMTERALVRAFDRQFPNLGKALRTMLARGRAGKRGGVVLLDDADPLHIARAFTSKTGTALSKSVQLFSDAGQVNGFFDPKSGMTFLVGPNLNPVTGPAVLLHEMSHGQQRTALDRRALEMLTTRGSVKNAELRAFLDRVAARMGSVGESGNAAEATAYIVEQAVMEGRSQGFTVADGRFLSWVDQNLGQRVGDFLRSALAMVRAFMLRHGMGVGEVTVDDLVGYAMVGMERAARGAVGGVEPAFSRSAMKSVEANVSRGREAMSNALNDRNSVHRAMFRNGLGWVDFVWGDEKKGIAHIIARRIAADHMTRSDVERMLTESVVETIARGSELRRNEFGGAVRLVLTHNQNEAILIRKPGSNAWMLTSFNVKPGAEAGGATQSSATQDAPIRSRGAQGAGKSIVDQDGDMNNAPGIKFSRSGLREVASLATAELDKAFSAPGGLSWWHKTVGTMYNLAQRSPAFKPVFEAAQGFVDDVSHYANDAADLAPKLLPKLDGWRDIMKSPVSAEDNKVLAVPVFEGSLSWTRDESGKPVRVDDVAAEAARMTTEQKAEDLRRRDKLPEGMLRAWQALPPEQFAKMIDSRYESQLLKPGVVWTDAELRDMFKLNDGQVALYREFRAAVDRSLDTMARADMLRFGGEDVKALRQQVMDTPSVQDAALLLRDHLSDTADAWPGRATDLLNVANGIMERAEKVTQLQAEGYAPLSRFGKYSVDVVDQTGERQYFGLFETKREANQMAEQMRAAFPGAEVSQGTMSEEAYKLFSGVTPETLELFGNALGFNSTGDSAQDRAFQQYLRLTKTNRSAMKRLIHRQGIAGYSEDVGRVLAAFVYSNARQTAAGLNLGDLTEAVDAIPKEQGELKDAAVRLAEYIKNPQEEAQAVRGLLFAQYLGGSIASAFVNMTQPVAVTFPWLSQYGGAKKAAAEIGRAAKEMAAKGHKYEDDLARALHEAEEDGTVSPQEVHQLMAQAQGRGSLRSGDGTKQGEALATAANGLKRLAFAWGKVFGLAEQANRRVTFIAAYRMGKEQGMADPAGFARQAVKETQFVYSKASKMQWGRGAVGGTLMTFKTYSIAYLELLHRMYTQGGPEGKRAALLALGVLMLMGGAGGLPFADDAADAADALAQLLGYNISTKAARQELLEQAFGRGIAGFIEKGITGLPGAPIDVSGRLGLGNLIPGTGLLQSKTSHTSDVLEIVGPAGDFAKRIGEGAAQVLHGNIASGLLTMAPQAVRNAAKGADMAATGMYRDAKGYKVLDTNPLEAAAKAIGFQPQSVARIQEANAEAQQAKNFYNLRAQEIRAKWAQGIFENDPGKVKEAREEIADWNAKNPDQRMLITVPSVMKRVKEMRKSKDQRIADTAPKAMRAQIRADLAQAREAP